MPDVQIVKVDDGGVNARILAKEVKADFRRVEAASLKLHAKFTSAEGKRLFVRLFSTLQLNMHFVSVIARTRLDHAEIDKTEAAIRALLDESNARVNKAIDGAEALFKVNGITHAATYDTIPLDLQVGVLSSFGRRYLELLTKLDQAMPLLQTLEIHEVITSQAVDIERAGLKRQVRNVANRARSLATDLRRKMNAAGPARAAAEAPAQRLPDAVAIEPAAQGTDAPSVEEAAETGRELGEAITNAAFGSAASTATE